MEKSENLVSGSGGHASQSRSEETERLDATHTRPGTHGDGVSTASIKSGVIGFPQPSRHEHAAVAEERLHDHQTIGAGASGQELGPGGAPPPLGETSRLAASSPPPTSPARAFPLAGGVRSEPLAPVAASAASSRLDSAPAAHARDHSAHVPRRSPSPPSLAQTSAPTYLDYSTASATGATHHGFHHTSALDPGPALQSSDAVIAGGLAAPGALATAGAGAHVAHEPHPKDPTGPGSKALPSADPHTSPKLDSHLNSPTRHHDQRQFDPKPSQNAATDASDLFHPVVPPDLQEQQAQPKEQHAYGHEIPATGAQHSARPFTSTNEQPYGPSAVGTQGTEGQPQIPQHHYGRDVAVAGGVGAAGAGASIATHKEKPTLGSTTQQPQSQHLHPCTAHPDAIHQRFDPGQEPNTSNHSQHQKRDAVASAAVGAAAGARGAYVYSSLDAEHDYKAAQVAQEEALKNQQKTFDLQQKEKEEALHQQQKEQEKALHQQQKEQEKEKHHLQKEQEKALHHQQKEIEREHAQQQKKHDKLIAAEDNKHHKQIEKEHREHEKLAVAEEKKHQELERERQRLQHQQQTESEHEGEVKGKKHHLLGFLHHDKKEQDEEMVQSSSHQMESEREGELKEKKHHLLGFLHHDKNGQDEELAQSSSLHTQDNALASPTYGSMHDEGRHTRNKLHKDPPPGHPAREALDQLRAQDHQLHQHSDPEGTGNRQLIGTDGPTADSPVVSGTGAKHPQTQTQTRAPGVSGAQDPPHHPIVI